jgi:hypothetical protein
VGISGANNVIKNKVYYWFALSVGLIFSTEYGTSWAQNSTDKAAADALFDEGTKLIAKNENAAACEKFEASLLKSRRVGTQMALAACYVKLGKTASAWSAFRAAADAAAAVHDKRQRVAEDQMKLLEAALSKIVIKIEITNRIDGLTVRWDGVEVTPAEFGTPVPIDPGEHVVEARAPGRVAWSSKLSIPSAPGVVEVSVPTLEKIPTPRDARSPRRIFAYGLGGAGIATIEVSLIFGAMAKIKWNDAQLQCHDRMCNQIGVDLAHRARNMGTVSTITFVAGTTALVTAVTLLLTAPKISTESERLVNTTTFYLAPDIGPTQVGLMLQKEF